MPEGISSEASWQFRPDIAGVSQNTLVQSLEGNDVTRKFEIGDHVSWNSEAGRVRGRIIRVHTRDVDYKGHTHHATPDAPQYEIQSDRTDHTAMHKGAALRKLTR